MDDMPRPLRRIETPLKTAIRESGLKQTWLAEECGVSRQHLSNVIHGLHPTDDLADALVRHLRRNDDTITKAGLWPHLFGRRDDQRIAA